MAANLDFASLGFGYIKTDKRYVSNFKNGAWDEGTLTEDDKIVISECAGVLQYAQTVFEGLKAYTTQDGHVVVFRPDLNAERMIESAKRLIMPEFPKERFIDAVRKVVSAAICSGNVSTTPAVPLSLSVRSSSCTSAVCQNPWHWNCICPSSSPACASMAMPLT